MYKFIKNIFIFILILCLPVTALVYKADGRTDPCYLRFTTSEKNSMILGSSRAAQGIRPSIINKVLGSSLYNFSFSSSQSPYGPIYYESIVRKLETSTKKNLFILEVNPWTISSTSLNPNDTSQFREINLCLDNTQNVSLDPNPIYLFNNLKGQYRKLLQNEKHMLLHEDGWLEIDVAMDSTSVNSRTNKKMKIYRAKNLPSYKFSKIRLEYLSKTIQELKKTGNVFLVRVPIHSRMLAIENELMPDFNSKILSISHLSNGFLDMTSDSAVYGFTDGNHISSENGIKVSTQNAEWTNSSLN